MATCASMRATTVHTASAARKSVAVKTRKNVAKMTDFATACLDTWGHSAQKVKKA